MSTTWNRLNDLDPEVSRALLDEVGSVPEREVERAYDDMLDEIYGEKENSNG